MPSRVRAGLDTAAGKKDVAAGVPLDMYLVVTILALAGCWVIVFAINK